MSLQNSHFTDTNPPIEQTHPFLSKFKTQIQNAARLVNRSLLRDEVAPDRAKITLSADSVFSKNNGSKAFAEIGRVEVPEVVAKILKEKRYSSKCGFCFFLGVVWFTSDNNVVFWDFVLKKYQVIKETSEIITAVAIIETPSDITNDLNQSKTLIFIATKDEIILLSGDRTDSQLFSLRKKYLVPAENSKIELIKAAKNGDIFALSADGTLFEIEYKGWKSALGNLLFGHGRKIRKIDRTTSIEKLIVPLKLIFGRKNGRLVDFALRAGQGETLIFAVDDNNGLWGWSKDIDSGNVSIVGSFLNIIKTVLKLGLCKYETFSSHRVFSVHALDPNESECSIFLLTDRGARIYFQLTNTRTLSLTGVKESLKDRLPPLNDLEKEPKSDKFDFYRTETNIRSEKSFYGDGFLLMSQSRQHGLSVVNPKNASEIAENRLTVEISENAVKKNFPTFSDFSEKPAEIGENHQKPIEIGENRQKPAEIGENRRKPTENDQNRPKPAEKVGETFEMETCASIELKDDVLALDELPSYLRRSDVAFYCYAEGKAVPMAGLSEGALSFSSANRVFFVLARDAIRIFEKNDSLRQLRDILGADFKTWSAAGFLNQFGEAEACAACLALICCDVLKVAALQPKMPLNVEPIDEKVASNAKSSFFTLFAGEPKPIKIEQNSAENKEPENKTSDRAERSLGQTETAVFKRIDFAESGRLAGLSLFLARLLRPLWRFPVFGFVQTKEFNTSVPFVVYPEKLLHQLIKPLDRLDSFLSTYKRLFYSHNNSIEVYANRQDITSCIRIEIDRFEGLHKITTRSSEILKYLAHISKSATAFNSVLNRLTEETKNALLETPFKAFVAEEAAEKTLKALMSATTVNNEEAEIAFLKRCCPSVFRIDNVFIANGERLLKKALSQKHNAKEFAEILAQSDIEFLNAVDAAADPFPLAQIAKSQREAQNFAGVLRVSLKLLQLLGVRAEMRRRLGPERGAGPRGEEAAEEALRGEGRKTALAAFFWALKGGPGGGEAMLAQMRRVAVESGDREFLFELFEFLARNGFGLFLLSFDSETKLLSQFVFDRCKSDISVAKVAIAVLLESKKFFDGAKLARFWGLAAKQVALIDRREFLEQSRRFVRAIDSPSPKHSNFDLATKQYQIRVDLQTQFLDFSKKQGLAASNLENELATAVELFRLAKKAKCYDVAIGLLDRHFLEDPAGETASELWRFIVETETKAAISLSPAKWKHLVAPVLSDLLRRHLHSPALRLESIALSLEKAHSAHSAAPSSWPAAFLLASGVDALALAECYAAVIDEIAARPRHEAYLADMRPNVSITLAVAKALEALGRELTAGAVSEERRRLGVGRGKALIAKWRGRLRKAKNAAEERVRAVVDKRFFTACVMFREEMGLGGGEEV